MPGFSDVLGADGPLIRVEVGVSGKGRQQLLTAGSPIPPPVMATALLDTGAEVSCIEPGVLHRLRLAPSGGVLPVNAPGLGGMTFSFFYAVCVTLLHPSGNPADHLVVSDLSVTEVTLGVVSIDML